MVLIQNSSSSSDISILVKLYIWSLIIDPLLFFVIFDKSSTGVSGNISKLLQFLVIIVLFLNKIIITKNEIKFPNPLNKMNRYFTFYFILIILSGIIGFFQGAYTLSSNFTKPDDYNFFSNFINGPYIRSFFEYFITLYNFGYFVLLPSYIIKNNDQLNYFFKIFFNFFLYTIILGYLDLILIQFFNIPFLPRHLYDGVHPGNRFHGLAGEPRDAFVYLIFVIGIMNLKQFWINGQFISKKMFIFILFTMMLTQSGSGLLGILFSAILIFLFKSDKFSFSKLLQIIGLLLLLFTIIYIGTISSERIDLYIRTFPELWEAIGDNMVIPAIFLGQMSNIYPIWDLLNSLMNFNFIPILIGKGLGSASAVSNRMGGTNELMNAHSQLVRLLYESGLIGVWLFIQAFLTPVKLILRKYKIIHNKDLFILFILFLLGAYFGHRSNTLFIYLGIFILVFNKLKQKNIVQIN